MITKSTNRTLAIAALCWLVVAPVSAQAVISGVVLGPDDLPVEGVTIYVTHVATSSQLEFPTLANGRFEFSGLADGEYRITSGSGALVNRTVTLRAGAPVVLELKMPFGPFSEEWPMLPQAVLSGVGNGGGRPGFRCSGRLIVRTSGVFMPLCNLAFMIDEFEAGEARRLEARGGAIALGPRIVRAPNQVYPAALLDAGIDGTVVLEARISIDGSLREVRVVRSQAPALVEPALASLGTATWESAVLRGKPVEVPVTVTISFQRQRTAAPPVRVVQSIAAQIVRVSPAEETQRQMVFFRPSGPYRITNYTVRELVRFAYSLDDAHIVGLPAWADSERFDVEQQWETEPTAAEVQALVRDILALRFRLTTHVEQREFPAYVLRRAGPQLGPQLRPSAIDCTRQPATGTAGVTPCQLRLDERGIYGAGLTVAQLANEMSGSGYIRLPRPVVDRTGLDGRFDMELSLIRMQRQPGPDGGAVRIASVRSELPLTELLERELGLRFEDGTSPNDVMVVDRVERPAR